MKYAHSAFGHRRVNIVMPLQRLDPKPEAWKDHWKHQKFDKKFYPLKDKRSKEVQENAVEVNLVAPTEQTVIRAKALSKKRKAAF